MIKAALVADLDALEKSQQFTCSGRRWIDLASRWRRSRLDHFGWWSSLHLLSFDKHGNHTTGLQLERSMPENPQEATNRSRVACEGDEGIAIMSEYVIKETLNAMVELEVRLSHIRKP